MTIFCAGPCVGTTRSWGDHRSMNPTVMYCSTKYWHFEWISRFCMQLKTIQKPWNSCRMTFGPIFLQVTAHRRWIYAAVVPPAPRGPYARPCTKYMHFEWISDGFSSYFPYLESRGVDIRFRILKFWKEHAMVFRWFFGPELIGAKEKILGYEQLLF